MESERVFLSRVKLKSHDVLKLGAKKKRQDREKENNHCEQEELCAKDQNNAKNI